MLLKRYKVVGDNIFKRERYKGAGSYCDGCKYYLSSGSFAACSYETGGHMFNQVCANDFRRWNRKDVGLSKFVYYPL